MPEKRFTNCEYGPFALRRLLRARLLPGERIVGWAPAIVNPPLFMLIAGAGLALIPGVGHLALLGLVANYRRVVILTDARLVVLSRTQLACDRSGRGVRLDAPLHALAIRPGRRRNSFEVQPGRGGRRERFDIEMTRPPGARLVQGLDLISGRGERDISAGPASGSQR